MQKLLLLSCILTGLGALEQPSPFKHQLVGLYKGKVVTRLEVTTFERRKYDVGEVDYFILGRHRGADVIIDEIRLKFMIDGKTHELRQTMRESELDLSNNDALRLDFELWWDSEGKGFFKMTNVEVRDAWYEI